MRALVALAREGRVTEIPVQTRPLEEAQRTLDDLKQGRVVGRVVLTP
jgi:propanol-preferring alcohol dehydrogenase